MVFTMRRISVHVQPEYAVMNIELTSTPNKDDDDFVVAKAREYNNQFVDKEFELISVYHRDDK